MNMHVAYLFVSGCLQSNRNDLALALDLLNICSRKKLLAGERISKLLQKLGIQGKDFLYLAVNLLNFLSSSLFLLSPKILGVRISVQEAVLALHKAQQQGTVSEMDYEIKIASYSQQMDELQERQRELKATAGRFAEVKYWMNTFKEHVHSGETMDTTDAVVLRQLTDRIVVYDDRLEIHLRIGGTLEQKYL